MLTPDLGEDIWEDHHTCRPEDHDRVVREEEKSRPGGVAEENPDGEESNGEEMGEEDERLLEKSRKHENRFIHTPELEVAEAAPL